MKMSEIRRLSQILQGENGQTVTEETARRVAEEAGIRLDNLYQELEMDDAYVDTHEDPGTYPEAIQLHSHNFFEILYIYSGSVQYLVGTERYRLQHGDMVLIPPGVSHRPMQAESGQKPYHRYVLWLSTEYVNSISCCFPRDEFQCPSILRTAGTLWNVIGERMKRGIREAERKKPGWKAMVYGNTMEVLGMLYRAVRGSQNLRLPSERPGLLDRVLNYIEENLDKKITLEQVAGHFYVGESTVSAVFRKEMGISFHRCVTQRRLIAAKTAIINGTSLEQVAEQVGFADYSTFYRSFKSEYGISPRQFKTQSLRQQELA